MSPEDSLRQAARVNYHRDRMALLDEIADLRACSACAVAAHVCRVHTPAKLRDLLVEAGRLLES